MPGSSPIKPVFDALIARFPGLRLFDVHTHVGANDPDGIALSAPDLIDALARVAARAAVFPLHEPDGYPQANDAVLAAAAASDRLVAFCRVDPRADPLAEAARCLDAGARGIKLHPASERFDLTHPAVEPIVALGAERGVPVLVHSGSNIDPLGPRALELCARHPDARLILAHVAISDGASLWERAAHCPNLFFDLSWWETGATLELLRRVPPGQLLHASDAPYGMPLTAAVCMLRLCLQAGLSGEQIASIAGGQAERLVAGDGPLDLGSAPAFDPIDETPLARALGQALAQIFRRRDAAALIDAVRTLAAGNETLAPLLSAMPEWPRDVMTTFRLLIVARAIELTPAADRG